VRKDPNSCRLSTNAIARNPITHAKVPSDIPLQPSLCSTKAMKEQHKFQLLGPDGPYPSASPGNLGGHLPEKIYGRLDCPSALRWISKGHYVEGRVFFADERTAKNSGFRPCGACMKAEYLLWKRENEI